MSASDISIILNENDDTDKFSLADDNTNNLWDIGETLVYPTGLSNQNFKIDIIEVVFLFSICA